MGTRENTRRKALVMMVMVLGLSAAACGRQGVDGSIALVEPVDGATVASPVHVVMSADGFIIEPAANGVGEGRGHFHIIIDAPCVEPRLTVAADEQHLHFGGGQLETDLELPPGSHTLCLQVADGSHVALDLTHEITITVSE